MTTTNYMVKYAILNDCAKKANVNMLKLEYSPKPDFYQVLNDLLLNEVKDTNTLNFSSVLSQVGHQNTNEPQITIKKKLSLFGHTAKVCSLISIGRTVGLFFINQEFFRGIYEKQTHEEFKDIPIPSFMNHLATAILDRVEFNPSVGKNEDEIENLSTELALMKKHGVHGPAILVGLDSEKVVGHDYVQLDTQALFTPRMTITRLYEIDNNAIISMDNEIVRATFDALLENLER